MIDGQLNYTFDAARGRASQPIMDVIETVDHQQCTGPRHATSGFLAVSMPLCWFVSRQATKYRTTASGTPSATDQAAQAGQAIDSGEKNTRLCLREKSLVRADATFWDMNLSRFASTKRSRIYESSISGAT